MKKTYLIIFFFPLFLIQPIFINLVQASSFDFQLIPRTTKSSSSDGYFSKIPLSPLTVQKGKLDFYKKDGFDFIRFEGDYDEKTGELKGIFTGASTSKNFPNSGAYYYCEFTAQIKKGEKNTTLKYYPTHGAAETLNHCYAQVVFDFEKNQRAPKDDWWPDDLVFDIQPLDSGDLEDSGIRFSDIAGQVEVLLPTGYDADGEPIFEDEEGWNHAKLDMPLPYGTKLRLDYKSRIVLSMPDMTTYEMKTSDNPNEPVVEIILPRKNKGDNVFKLMAGQLWNNVKKMVKEGSMEIEMGQAVAGIKGTTFVLIETGTESKLAVLEGKVEFKSKNKKENIIVSAGEKITADSSGLKTKEKFDIEAEIKKWEIIQYRGDSSQKNNQLLPRQKQSLNKLVYGVAASVLAIIIGGLWFLIKEKKKKAKI